MIASLRKATEDEKTELVNIQEHKAKRQNYWNYKQIDKGRRRRPPGDQQPETKPEETDKGTSKSIQQENLSTEGWHKP